MIDSDPLIEALAAMVREAEEAAGFSGHDEGAPAEANAVTVDPEAD